MKKTGPLKHKTKSQYTLKEVHEYVSTSKGLWSENVIKDREDRMQFEFTFFVDISAPKL